MQEKQMYDWIGPSTKSIRDAVASFSFGDHLAPFVKQVVPFLEHISNNEHVKMIGVNYLRQGVDLLLDDLHEAALENVVNDYTGWQIGNPHGLHYEVNIVGKTMFAGNRDSYHVIITPERNSKEKNDISGSFSPK